MLPAVDFKVLFTFCFSLIFFFSPGVKGLTRVVPDSPCVIPFSLQELFEVFFHCHLLH